MVLNNIELQGIGVKSRFPIVDIYYADPLPVFNFTGIELPAGATISGVILIATLEPTVPGYGAVAYLDLSTGTFTPVSGAYSTTEQQEIEVGGVSGIHKRRV